MDSLIATFCIAVGMPLVLVVWLWLIVVDKSDTQHQERPTFTRYKSEKSEQEKRWEENAR